MKNNRILNRLVLLIIVIFLTSLITGNTIEPLQNNTNLPAGFEPVIYYDKRTGKLYAKSYDQFSYGIDSALHEIDVKNGKNYYYFVLFDMSIEFTIRKYDE